MALVAYDNSDSSEFEDDDEPSPRVDPISSGPTISKFVTSPEQSSASLFNFLPQPSSKKLSVVEEDDEFLHKKETPVNIEKPKVKITVPSLSDFKDVQSPTSKPKTTSSVAKKSGLLGLLPQPKSSVVTVTKSNSLVPDVLKQQTNKPPDKAKTLPNPVKTVKPEIKNKLLGEGYSDDSDDDDEGTTDFFSMNKPEPLPEDTTEDTYHEKKVEEEVPIPLVQEPVKISRPSSQKLPASIQAYLKQTTSNEQATAENSHGYDQTMLDNHQNAHGYDQNAHGYDQNAHGYVQNAHGHDQNAHGHKDQDQYNSMPSGSNDVQLDDEAIRQLCGTRGKRKREEIQIVDVNQQEVLADSREWLLKGLMDDTSKRVSSSKKNKGDVTMQQKRKHQITYLAQQAKANEAELQNQWANSRVSRRQTQSKYGF